MAVDYFASLGGGDDDENRRELVDGGVARDLGGESPTVLGSDQSRQPGASQQTEGEKKTASGSFTNLNAYLDANSGRQFGQEVAGRVQSSIDDANREQDAAGQTFRQKADENTVQKDDELLSRVRTKPTDVAGNEQSFNAFTRMRDARYRGPQRLMDLGDTYQNVAGKTDRAAQTAATTQTEEGRKAFLDESYGKGAGRFDYTPGQIKLDNLLIQNDPNSRAAFEQARAAGEASKSRFADLEQALNQYGQQAATTTAAARSGARSTLGIDDAGNVLPFGQGGTGAIQQNVDTLDSRVGDYLKKLDAEKARLAGIGGTKSVSQLNADQRAVTGAEMGRFKGVDARVYDPIGYTYSGYTGEAKRGQVGDFVAGGAQPTSFNPERLTPASTWNPDAGDSAARQKAMALGTMFNPYLTAQGDQFYGVDPGKFLTFAGKEAFNRSSVAEQDDLSALDALAKLAGTQQSWISDPNQVGRAKDTKLSEFRKDDFLSGVDANRSSFENELKTLRDARTANQRTSGGEQYTVYDFGQLDPSKRISQYNALRAKYGLPPV